MVQYSKKRQMYNKKGHPNTKLAIITDVVFLKWGVEDSSSM